MTQYNVEIFSPDFSLKHHTNVSDVMYSMDYLSPQNNNITILFYDGAEKGDYIRIVGDNDEYVGIIKSISNSSRELTSITYESFLSVFNTQCLFDTDWQGGNTSLEQTLANIINGMFVNNTDTSMNIAGLSVITQGATSSWGFNLKSDTEGKHKCIINLYNVLIVRSLEKYSVRLKPVFDFEQKTIKLYIGKSTNDIVTIEADLPNIIEQNVIIKETSNDTNKLVVYNTENYLTSRTYYRHPDDTYNMSDTNRILPVVQEIHAVAPERNGDTITKTFAQQADSDAANTLGNLNYNNLIELVVLNDDTLVKPYDMEIGQIVSVISKGKSYKSILTGIEKSDKTLLSFGTIRIDLTKILKRGYR